MPPGVPFGEFPYYPQFTFSSIAAGTNNTIELLIPHNIAVYGIAIQASDLPEVATYYNYQIQFQDYETGATLFDEPIQAYNIQTDCRTFLPPNVTKHQGGGFILPSKWFIKKNQKIVCKLNTFAASDTESYWVTLLGYTTDEHPNPGISPFVYSYPMQMGFQDNANASGQTSVNFNQQICNTLGKHMLHDFELHSITLDPFGTDGFNAGSAGAPFWSFSISMPGRKLVDRYAINGTWGGGSLFQQGQSVVLNGNTPANVIDDNIWQYVFPEPILIPKKQVVRVDISPAVTYVASNLIHSTFNQRVCMALIGNHLHG